MQKVKTGYILVKQGKGLYAAQIWVVIYSDFLY